MASVASQLIEEVTTHGQRVSLEGAREICAEGTYFPNNLRKFLSKFCAPCDGKKNKPWWFTCIPTGITAVTARNMLLSKFIRSVKQCILLASDYQYIGATPGEKSTEE
jgi:hypothetical protein